MADGTSNRYINCNECNFPELADHEYCTHCGTPLERLGHRPATPPPFYGYDIPPYWQSGAGGWYPGWHSAAIPYPPPQWNYGYWPQEESPEAYQSPRLDSRSPIPCCNHCGHSFDNSRCPNCGTADPFGDPSPAAEQTDTPRRRWINLDDLPLSPMDATVPLPPLQSFTGRRSPPSTPSPLRPSALRNRTSPRSRPAVLRQTHSAPAATETMSYSSDIIPRGPPQFSPNLPPVNEYIRQMNEKLKDLPRLPRRRTVGGFDNVLNGLSGVGAVVNPAGKEALVLNIGRSTPKLKALACAIHYWLCLQCPRDTVAIDIIRLRFLEQETQNMGITVTYNANFLRDVFHHFDCECVQVRTRTRTEDLLLPALTIAGLERYLTVWLLCEPWNAMNALSRLVNQGQFPAPPDASEWAGVPWQISGRMVVKLPHPNAEQWREDVHRVMVQRGALLDGIGIRMCWQSPSP